MMEAASESSKASRDQLQDPIFLQELRSTMLKFAVKQLADEHLAEDAVQEALAGALKNVKAFDRRAALKTWMFAILKNKIADILRKKQRNIDASALSGEYAENDDMNHLFDTRGHWQDSERPKMWALPEDQADNDQFWLVFETCLSALPEKQARFFMMREFIELETDEICNTTGVSVSNLNVILYRARLRLRECLEDNWFKG